MSRPILVFLLAGLRALVGIIALLVTIVIGGLAQVLIFSTRWPVATSIAIVSSRGLNCVDPNGRGGALMPGAVRAAIATISIAPILLVVLARSFGLGGLGAMKRHGSCLMRAERNGALVPSVILSGF